MAQLFNLDESGKLTLANVALSNVTGDVIHQGSYTLWGNSFINGTLTVDTIQANNIINNSPNTKSEVGNWIGQQESEINGVGLQWTWGLESTQLIYRTGNKLYTNASFDLAPTSAYNIDGVAVLKLSGLGPTVQSSNLTSLGKLNSLAVSGDTNLGDFAFFNSTFGRLGLGNEDPSIAIDILENNVNLVLGSPTTNLAIVGTASNHDLSIITDNLARIVVKNNGEVIIGDDASKNGIVRINGSLYVDNLVSDTRIDRSSPLQFKATHDRSIYGLGITWSDDSISKNLILQSSPDRIWSTESIDIDQDKSYYINGQPVVSSSALGSGITLSNLTTVGVLQSLAVSGPATLGSDVTIAGPLNTSSIVLDTDKNNVNISSSSIDASNFISLTVQNSSVVYGDKNSIQLGNPASNRTPIKLFGPVSVNINNPDPDVQFSVNGDIKVADRRFTNGTIAPAQGSFELGDICWNTKPQGGGYIGWVCVLAGTPGNWAPFGLIV